MKYTGKVKVSPPLLVSLSSQTMRSLHILPEGVLRHNSNEGEAVRRLFWGCLWGKKFW